MTSTVYPVVPRQLSAYCQSEIQEPKMEALYHRKPYFECISLYIPSKIGLKKEALWWLSPINRYLQWPLILGIYWIISPYIIYDYLVGGIPTP